MTVNLPYINFFFMDSCFHFFFYKTQWQQILRRGPLEMEEKNALRTTMMHHRHLNWIQLDLDEYALQPMPVHERMGLMDKGKGGKRKRRVAHHWPRMALTRTSPALLRKRTTTKKKQKHQKEKKKIKKKNKNKNTMKKTSQKDVTSWRWYPSTLSLNDSIALHEFVETADATDWLILDELSSEASKRLRVVEVK